MDGRGRAPACAACPVSSVLTRRPACPFAGSSAAAIDANPFGARVLRCIVEIYIFYEMTADPRSSVCARIEIIDLKDTPPYTSEGCIASETDAAHLLPSAPGASVASLARPRAGRSSRPTRQRFDVRATTCEVESDKERLLSVIEGIGAGFERFNEWMHNLLVLASERSSMVEARGTSTTRSPSRIVPHFRLPPVPREQRPSASGSSRPSATRPFRVHPADSSALEG
jgi:hypothetical protein